MMMKFSVLVSMGLAGCVAPAFTPAHTPKPDNAFGAATRALIEDGESIETKDDSAGVIITKWDESKDPIVGEQSRRLRWKITFGADITVDSQCQDKDTRLLTGHDWQDCAGQPRDRSGKAAAIAKRISETHVDASGK